MASVSEDHHDPLIQFFHQAGRSGQVGRNVAEGNPRFGSNLCFLLLIVWIVVVLSAPASSTPAAASSTGIVVVHVVDGATAGARSSSSPRSSTASAVVAVIVVIAAPPVVAVVVAASASASSLLVGSSRRWWRSPADHARWRRWHWLLLLLLLLLLRTRCLHGSVCLLLICFRLYRTVWPAITREEVETLGTMNGFVAPSRIRTIRWCVLFYCRSVRYGIVYRSFGFGLMLENWMCCLFVVSFVRRSLHGTRTSTYECVD